MVVIFPFSLPSLLLEKSINVNFVRKFCEALNLSILIFFNFLLSSEFEKNLEKMAGSFLKTSKTGMSRREPEAPVYFLLFDLDAGRLPFVSVSLKRIDV